MDIINSLIDGLNQFLELGIPVIAPTLLFLLGLLFGVRLGRNVRSALTYGIGFVGIFLVLDLLLSNLGEAATAMAERTGLQFEILDVGWPVLATVAFAVPTFVTVFFGMIILNLVMFVAKWTITLDIDFHNYYHWVLPATVVYFATGNLVAGTIVGLASGVITLKLADWTEGYVHEWWDLPGISIPHMSSVGWFPFCYLVDWIIDRIPGVNRIRVDPGRLQERLGVVGEPMLLGFIIGVAIGIAAGYNVGQIVLFAVNMGAAMILMPRMISLLMEGLVPIFQAGREWVVNRFPGYEFRLGMDAALLVGKSEVLVLGLLAVPIMVVLALILPGNRVLPFADLAILAFFTMWGVGVNRGNLFRGLIIATLTCVVILYGAGWMGPTLTAMGSELGYVAEGADVYTSLEAGAIVGSQMIHAPIMAIAQSGLNGWLVALIAIALVPVALVVFRFIITRPRLAADLEEDGRAEAQPYLEPVPY
jgi:PTS system galactitol-specific IIC component